VIVHASAVDAEASLGNPLAIRVQETIQRIRGDSKNRVIEVKGAPRVLSPLMPPTSDNVEVEVSGAYRDFCVASQLLALRSAGYRAKFHATGCLMGKREVPPELVRNILQMYSDFYD